MAQLAQQQTRDETVGLGNGRCTIPVHVEVGHGIQLRQSNQ